MPVGVGGSFVFFQGKAMWGLFRFEGLQRKLGGENSCRHIQDNFSKIQAWCEELGWPVDFCQGARTHSHRCRQ